VRILETLGIEQGGQIKIKKYDLLLFGIEATSIICSILAILLYLNE